MTICDIPSAPTVHSALRRRFSPTAFDPHHELNDAQVDVLLDAARLAPSAGNSQPWRFIVGKRGDAVHERIVSHLAGSSAAWAPDASLIVVNIAHVLVEGTDWEFSEFARYDLGQAVAHMTLQASWMGMDAHQFRAFDRDAVTRDFDVPREWGGDVDDRVRGCRSRGGGFDGARHESCAHDTRRRDVAAGLAT